MTVAPGSNLQYGALEAEVGEVFVASCDGSREESVSVDEELDLLDDAVQFELPAGTWCVVEVLFDGPLVVEGSGVQTGEDFALEIEPDDLFIEASSQQGFDIAGTDLLLELATVDWITEDSLGLDDGEVLIVPGDPAHEDLVVAVNEGSALFDDADGDGALGDDERSAARPGRKRRGVVW